MNKAIIVTRSTEYSAHDDFNKAIENRESCKYNTQENLQKFLIARKNWEKEVAEKRDKNTDDKQEDIYSEAYKSLFNLDHLPADIQDTNLIPYKAIKSLMDSTNVTQSHPYASFEINENTDMWEVILVLYDKISIQKDECVDPADLFLDSICQDLGIAETEGDHVLYVHDKQVGLTGDGILVENHELRNYYGENENFYNWTEKKAQTFKRIAYFVHEQKDTDFFKVNILTKNFGGENILCRKRRKRTADDI